MSLTGANDMMSRFANGVTLALVAFLTFSLATLVAAPANAQVSKGSISGSVTDPQGAAVLGASVRVVSKDTNQAYAAETDSAGLFRLSLLPPGSYRVEVTKQGFRKVVFDSIEVSVGADRGLGAVKLPPPLKFRRRLRCLRARKRRSRILSHPRVSRLLLGCWRTRGWTILR